MMNRRAIARRPSLVSLAFCGIFFTMCSQTQMQPGPDLVLFNGKIQTLTSPGARVSALAARDGLVVAAGSDQEIRQMAGPGTRVIDLEGRLAVPGFIEGHGHFLGLGQQKTMLDLSQARTWEDIVAQVAAAARETPAGQWIRGRGWHQDKWHQLPEGAVEGVPTHRLLSRAAPGHPVLLSHASGHASIGNEAAMRLAGITSRTEAPSGGEIVKDRAGNPTGLFRETAQSLLFRALERVEGNRSSEEQAALARRWVELAEQECLSKGVTSFHDAGVPLETVDLYRSLNEEGHLTVRLWVMLGGNNRDLKEKLSQYRLVDDPHRRLTVRAVKRMMDGALGTHGAWLLAPYSDMPAGTGLNTIAVEDLREAAEMAVQHDFQLCTHAIGDKANRVVLDVYQEAFERHGKEGLRWRIEHAQHLHPQDIPRFGALGVIASVQGIHCVSDAPWVPARLGAERAAQGAYVWRSLIDSGARLANGTDVPVEDVDPIANFHALVSRKTRVGVFHPEQRLTREEALRAYTLDNAYAAFEEDIKGSLEPGKLADITVLFRDIMTVAEDEIPGTRVVYTIVGGRVVYAADSAEQAAGGRQ
jgi:predicted amidohydrolase YtcJ